MIYKIIRPIVRFATKLYFRKIYISGVDNIPKDKAIILACNHPSAFIEPCMLACYLPLSLHFLVRGDLFSKGWLSWLLKGTNQIPIFRQKDGLDNVRKNLITQKAVTELFQHKKSLLMFPEAHTHENLFLRPLKKGIARFALLDHGSDLYILPVGVNFDKNIGFASKVSLVVGKAISVSDFRNEKHETDAKMHKDLLKRVSTEMKACLRHIEHEDREELIHESYRVMDLKRKEYVYPVVSETKEIFVEEKVFATAIDSREDVFNNLLKRFSSIKIPNIKRAGALEFLLMILLLPLFSLAVLFHGLPVFAVRQFIRKKITMHEFKAPVFLGILIFLYIFILLIGGILSLFFGLTFLLYFLTIQLIGVIGVFYYKAFHQKWKYLFVPKASKEELDEQKKWIVL